MDDSPFIANVRYGEFAGAGQEAAKGRFKYFLIFYFFKLQKTYESFETDMASQENDFNSNVY